RRGARPDSTDSQTEPYPLKTERAPPAGPFRVSPRLPLVVNAGGKRQGQEGADRERDLGPPRVPNFTKHITNLPHPSLASCASVSHVKVLSEVPIRLARNGELL